MIERVLELETAATDKLLGSQEGESVFGSDGIAGFAGNAIVDSDLAGNDSAFGFLAAVAKPALNQCLIHAAHVRSMTDYPLHREPKSPAVGAARGTDMG